MTRSTKRDTLDGGFAQNISLNKAKWKSKTCELNLWNKATFAVEPCYKEIIIIIIFT